MFKHQWYQLMSSEFTTNLNSKESTQFILWSFEAIKFKGQSEYGENCVSQIVILLRKAEHKRI